MEGKSLKVRAAICLSLVAIIFAVYCVRLFDWQIIQGEKYRGLAFSSVSYTQTSEAVRGEILDTNGVPFAVNEPRYILTLDKIYIDKDSENDTILRLADILANCGEKWNDILPILLNTDGSFEFAPESEKEKEKLITEILQLPSDSDAESCIRALAERYSLTAVTDRKNLRTLISVKYNMELSGYSSSNPYVMSENLSQSSVAVISELTQNIPGAEITTRLVRVNRNSDLAPHIVGALGSLTEEDYARLKDSGYSYNDRIGKFGIEQALETQLKGKGGSKVVQKNSDGTVVGVVRQTDAQPGNTVYLTIDSNIQKAANKALAENIAAARAAGKAEAESKGDSGYGEDCVAGAAVMLNVKDFSVIAASTYPGFDLGLYYDSDYYSQLANDPLSPLFDRAFNGAFAPGSVFKPAVACAALQEKVVSPDETVFCSKKYDYFPGVSVSCMGYHRSINISGALEKSCNYFFSEMGRRLGIETLYLYAQKFGLGMRTGVEIPESTGMLAGRDSTQWYEANVVSASIGQSDNAFTPIQLATYAATIANNGVRCRTHLISKITDYSRTQVILKNDPENPEIIDNIEVSPENLKIVQDGMRKVVLTGTARSVFADYPIAVAAKTGTAENSGSDHVNFICYAPYDDPQVAVAVVLEHGASSKYSMAIAKAMLDAFFTPTPESGAES